MRQSRKELWVVLSSHCSSKKADRMAREAMDICLRVLKKSNKVGSTATKSGTVQCILIISHVTFRDSRVHIFSNNLSRISCILTVFYS